MKAHRVSYALANGTLPKASVVRHTCDNPPCVNPAHLLAGTQKENMADRKARKRHSYYFQTHCVQGHEYTEENTYIGYVGTDRQQRLCRICRQKYQKKFRLRKSRERDKLQNS